MKCSECDKVATRQGTNSRVYCTAHIAIAAKQIGYENRTLSARLIAETQDRRDDWRHEYESGNSVRVRPKAAASRRIL